MVGRPTTVTGLPTDPVLDPREVSARKRALVNHDMILPYVTQLLRPSCNERPEVVAAGALALGRCCQDPGSFELLMRLARQPNARDVVRESAALAMGLLRRSLPDRQFSGHDLDRVRAFLLTLYDDQRTPRRVRAFALFSLGLLADQPHGSAVGRYGQLTVKALADRLRAPGLNPEATIALLTALGLHDLRAIPERLIDEMRRIVLGRNMYRRAWNAEERSHALTALGRWERPGSFVTVLRVATDRRVPTQVRRAAFSALARGARRYTPEERVAAAQSVERGIRSCRDDLSRGLAHLAMGRLLGNDLSDGQTGVLRRTKVAPLLLSHIRNAPAGIHGFSVLALALSARDVDPDVPEASAHLAACTERILEAFERTASNAARRAPLVVALGLLRASQAMKPLTTLMTDRNAPVELRGHAALAIGMIGRADTPTVQELRRTLRDHRSAALSSEAALALSFLSGRRETRSLIEAIESDPPQWVRAQITAALGQLGDIEAVDTVLAIARDRSRDEETRALSVSSLGLLGDPEARPGLLRLTRDANYFALTEALAEVFTIL